MKRIKISALVIAIILSVTGIYGTAQKGGQTFSAAASQPVTGTQDVLTTDDETTHLNCMMGNTHQNICTFVTKPDAPKYKVGQAVPRKYIQAIIHSHNP